MSKEQKLEMMIKCARMHMRHSDRVSGMAHHLLDIPDTCKDERSQILFDGIFNSKKRAKAIMKELAKHQKK